MKLNLDIESIKEVTLGIGLDRTESPLCTLPIDDDTESYIKTMVTTTLTAMNNCDDGCQEYSPSETYASEANLYWNTNSEINDNSNDKFRKIYEANNFGDISFTSSSLSKMIFYFAILECDNGEKFIALRQASKAGLLLKKRVFTWDDDSLKSYTQPIIQLHEKFDMIISKEGVHILRPLAFEAIGNLKDKILSASLRNMQIIKKNMAYVDFDNVNEYVSTHIRAARYVAAIIQKDRHKNIKKSKLKAACKKHHITFKPKKVNNKLCVNDEHIPNFLALLDDRIYASNLRTIDDHTYIASKRENISPKK